MPDRTKLKIDDRIRLLCVPVADVKQREEEIASGAEDPGWTANTIERVIQQSPIVTISEIDEYGHPWFEWIPLKPMFPGEEHRMMIMDNESWEHA
jgi:hypothetical protein